jgi:tetratricopeptide (TPR) repeat protein
MKILFTLFLLLAAAFMAMACLNYETAVLKNGVIIYEDEEHGIIPTGHNYIKHNYNKVIKDLDSLYNISKDVRYLSDKGYVLILQKKYKEAIQLYLNIEKLKPNRYMTASNIGTAYELIGDNQNALKWMNKAFTLDNRGHKGSEWIHINILEAKIKGDSCINSKYLLKLDLGNKIAPNYIPEYKYYNRLRKHLYTQLQERVSFIKTKDKIMAQLLVDLGNLEIILADYQAAISIFKMAQQYGYDPEFISQKINFTSAKIK